MLHIEIPSDGPSGLTFNKLVGLGIPSPKNGFNPEINNNVIFSFENEQEAVNYTHELDSYAETIKDKDPAAFAAIGDIIKAISEDGFVQFYIQS